MRWRWLRKQERIRTRHASAPRKSRPRQPWHPVLPAALAACPGAAGGDASATRAGALSPRGCHRRIGHSPPRANARAHGTDREFAPRSETALPTASRSMGRRRRPRPEHGRGRNRMPWPTTARAARKATGLSRHRAWRRFQWRRPRDAHTSGTGPCHPFAWPGMSRLSPPGSGPRRLPRDRDGRPFRIRNGCPGAARRAVNHRLFARGRLGLAALSIRFHRRSQARGDPLHLLPVATHPQQALEQARCCCETQLLAQQTRDAPHLRRRPIPLRIQLQVTRIDAASARRTFADIAAAADVRKTQRRVQQSPLKAPWPQAAAATVRARAILAQAPLFHA